MNFKEKVQSMTAKEIIMAMVEGLQNPIIKINDISEYVLDGICFGCIVTNTICKISGKTFDKESLRNRSEKCKFIGTDDAFLEYLETSINELSKGHIGDCNYYGNQIGIATITNSDISLPYLDEDYSTEDLQAYIKLANMQS